MSHVVINVLSGLRGGAGDFEARFAARAGTVSAAPGFEAFELMRPLEGGRYLVYTRWASAEAFEAWMSSGQFSKAHSRQASRGPLSAESEVWRFEVLDAEYGTG